MKINKNTAFVSLPAEGKVKNIIILTCVLLFLAFQSVLIYAVFLSFNVSYSATAPKIILDKTEEVYISKLAGILETGGRLFNDRNKETHLKDNMDTVENLFIKELDSASGDTLESVLLSSRIIFNRGYSLKNLRTIARLLEDYAKDKIKNNETKKAAAAINSILSMAMTPQIGFDSEKPLICNIFTYSFKSRVTKLIEELLNSGAKIGAEDLNKLLVKLVRYEAAADSFAEAVKHEKEACLRMMENNFYGINPRANRLESILTIMFVKGTELYYGDIAAQYKKIMDDLITAAGLEYSLAVKKFDELNEAERAINKSRIYILAVLQSKINPLVLWVTPSCSEYYNKFNVQKAFTAAAVIKLAARAIKDSEGADKIPSKIGDFKSIPEIKNNAWILNDPFTGKPLIYKKSDTGEITLYSAGYDARDDGGSFNDNKDIKL